LSLKALVIFVFQVVERMVAALAGPEGERAGYGYSEEDA
jgi:hypothetical protein